MKMFDSQLDGGTPVPARQTVRTPLSARRIIDNQSEGSRKSNEKPVLMSSWIKSSWLNKKSSSRLFFRNCIVKTLPGIWRQLLGWDFGFFKITYHFRSNLCHFIDVPFWLVLSASKYPTKTIDVVIAIFISTNYKIQSCKNILNVTSSDCSSF